MATAAKSDVKVDRGTRLFANSTAEILHEARVLAVRHVKYGEKGTTQDLLNYLICALSKDPKLSDRLYREGKEIFQKHDFSKPEDN